MAAACTHRVDQHQRECLYSSCCQRHSLRQVVVAVATSRMGGLGTIVRWFLCWQLHMSGPMYSLHAPRLAIVCHAHTRASMHYRTHKRALDCNEAAHTPETHPGGSTQIQSSTRRCCSRCSWLCLLFCCDSRPTPVTLSQTSTANEWA